MWQKTVLLAILGSLVSVVAAGVFGLLYPAVARSLLRLKDRIVTFRIDSKLRAEKRRTMEHDRNARVRRMERKGYRPSEIAADLLKDGFGWGGLWADVAWWLEHIGRGKQPPRRIGQRVRSLSLIALIFFLRRVAPSLVALLFAFSICGLLLTIIDLPTQGGTPPRWLPIVGILITPYLWGRCEFWWQKLRAFQHMEFEIDYFDSPAHPFTDGDGEHDPR